MKWASNFSLTVLYSLASSGVRCKESRVSPLPHPLCWPKRWLGSRPACVSNPEVICMASHQLEWLSGKLVYTANWTLLFFFYSQHTYSLFIRLTSDIMFNCLFVPPPPHSTNKIISMSRIGTYHYNNHKNFTSIPYYSCVMVCNNNAICYSISITWFLWQH